jgi:uncharacterized oxidoreductase
MSPQAPFAVPTVRGPPGSLLPTLRAVGPSSSQVKLFLHLLIANKGMVINVSSGLAFVPLPAAPIYSATKAAIHSYTQSLRFQLEETGVEGIELCPQR